MKTYALLIATSAMALAALPAHAAVRYHFEALSSFPQGPLAEDSISGSLSFTTSDFITTNTVAPLTSCVASGSSSGALSCREVRFLPSYFGYDAVNFYVAFRDGSEAAPVYYFESGAFGAAGTYDTKLFGTDQAGRLIVTVMGGAVPEPASWAMMIAGFGLVGGAMRRRNALTMTKVSYA